MLVINIFPKDIDMEIIYQFFQDYVFVTTEALLRLNVYRKSNGEIIQEIDADAELYHTVIADKEDAKDPHHGTTSQTDILWQIDGKCRDIISICTMNTSILFQSVPVICLVITCV